jgi:hypothetical protein
MDNNNKMTGDDLNLFSNNFNILNIMIENFITENFGYERKDTIMALLGAIVVIFLFIISNNLSNKIAGDNPSSNKKINITSSKALKSSTSSSEFTESESSFLLSSSSSSSLSGGKGAANVNKGVKGKPIPKKSKLSTFIIGLIAFMGPRLYILALTNKKFVNKLDSFIDVKQLKLRNIVSYTKFTNKDDELLNKIDIRLDKYQEEIKLRASS